MKRKRHTPEQACPHEVGIISKLREADTILASGATVGHWKQFPCIGHRRDILLLARRV